MSVAARLELIDPTGNVDSQLDALDRACRSVGFFRIPHQVVEEAIRERAWADAAEFFALPPDTKAEVGFPEVGYPYGYSPYAFEALAASTSDGLGDNTAVADLKESFSVGPDCLGSVIDLTEPNPIDAGSGNADQAWLRSPSLWPDEPASMRASWTDAFRAFSDVAAQLLSMMALALDLPADYFETMIDRHSSAMRVNHYPAVTGPAPAGALRAGPHSDYGTLTILRTDGVPGLEVQRPDGSWIPVADEPDTFVVNLGDSIAQWTNDRWRSTVHRVTPVDRERARMSMAFFHMANWDARIECLPTCRVPGEEPSHEPVLAGPWLMSKFQRTVA